LERVVLKTALFSFG